MSDLLLWEIDGKTFDWAGKSPVTAKLIVSANTPGLQTVVEVNGNGVAVVAIAPLGSGTQPGSARLTVDGVVVSEFYNKNIGTLSLGGYYYGSLHLSHTSEVTNWNYPHDYMPVPWIGFRSSLKFEVAAPSPTYGVISGAVVIV